MEIINGDRVGTVIDVARIRRAAVSKRCWCALDSDKVVWIDPADVRYDRADGIVMTNLDRSDLRQMADERSDRINRLISTWLASRPSGLRKPGFLRAIASHI